MRDGECRVCAESLPCTRSPMCPKWSWCTYLAPWFLQLPPRKYPLITWALKVTGACNGRFHKTVKNREPVPVIDACPSHSTRKWQHTEMHSQLFCEQGLLAYHHSSGLRGRCLSESTSCVFPAHYTPFQIPGMTGMTIFILFVIPQVISVSKKRDTAFVLATQKTYSLIA